MAWNPIQMKQENLSVLRNVFLKQHSATKPQLAKLSGLSVVTVNSLIHELLETGEVIQSRCFHPVEDDLPCSISTMAVIKWH